MVFLSHKNQKLKIVRSFNNPDFFIIFLVASIIPFTLQINPPKFLGICILYYSNAFFVYFPFPPCLCWFCYTLFHPGYDICHLHPLPYLESLISFHVCGWYIVKEAGTTPTSVVFTIPSLTYFMVKLRFLLSIVRKISKLYFFCPQHELFQSTWWIRFFVEVLVAVTSQFWEI